MGLGVGCETKVRPFADVEPVGGAEASGGDGQAGAPAEGARAPIGPSLGGSDTGSGGALPAAPDMEGGQAGRGLAGAAGDGVPAGAGGEGGAPGPMVDPECDYLEASDATNYDMAESTMTTLGESLVICGQVDDSRQGASTVDVDLFSYTVEKPTDYVATLELEQDDYRGVIELTAKSTFDTVLAHSAKAAGASAVVFNQHVDVYGGLVKVTATDESAALKVPIKYKIRIRRQPWSTGCPTVTPAEAAQTYDEAMDGTNAAGNDIVRLDPAAVTNGPTTAADEVELSKIVLGPGESSLIRGVSAKVSHAADPYFDGDMYRFRTGDINQVTFRLDWAAKQADLDVFLFEENSYAILDAGASLDPNELRSFIVQPNKNYWLWVGAYEDTASTALPQSYDLTLCGKTFAN